MTRRFFFAVAAVLVAFAVQAQPGDNHFDKGTGLFRAGKWAAARTEFVKARAVLADDRGMEAERLDCYIAVCAGRDADPDAAELLDGFMAKYPASIYLNDVRYARGLLYYAGENWARAADVLAEVDPLSLAGGDVGEYYFKTGVALFHVEDYRRADRYFGNVAADSRYGVHARYYRAYIQYAEGNYGAAKTGFAWLAREDAYAEIAPYYILQIEFLEGDYQYVADNGDRLLERAAGARKVEIARVMAESYFHLEYYQKALAYMERYEQGGGVVGRDEDYIIGYSRYMAGDYGAAAPVLARVIGDDDELSQNAAYHLADCYVRMGDTQRAMQSFAMASSMEWNGLIKEDALFNYGKLQYELGGGTFNEAVNILGRYVAEYPNSARVEKAREYLAAAYYNSNNYAAAYAAIRQIARPDNNMLAALQKISYFRGLEQFSDGNLNEALSLLNESLAARANSKYTALGNFWKAEILYRKGEYKGAIPLYRDFMLLAPTAEKEHIMASYSLGYCYFNLEQWANAATNFNRFLGGYNNRDSYRADALNRMGDIEFAQRSFRKATEYYDQAIGINTDERFYGQYQRAVTLGLAGQSDAKVGSLLDIIAKNRGAYVDDATYELGRTYVGMQRYADASRVLKGFLDKYPQSPHYMNAVSDLGLISQNLGDNANAMKYYKMVVDKAPSSQLAKDAMIGIRGAYMETGSMDDYFKYAKSVGIETDLGTVQRDSLSFAAAERQYITASDKSKAEPALKNYVRNFPNGVYTGKAYYYVAESRLAAGDKAGAMENYAVVGNMYHNEYTVRALEKLSKLAFEAGRYKQAAEAYDKLSRESVNPATVNDALTGYLRSVVAQKDHKATVAAVEEITGRGALTAELRREADYARAAAYEQIGDKARAMELYAGLATETRTLEGAVSTFKTAENLYSKGELKKAKDMIIAMGKQNTPHTYWLGRAFIVLGDIYAKEGDAFQARATFQSIIDGYSPADDGVVDAARERIKNLK